MSNRGFAAGVFRAWGVMWWIYVLLALPKFVNTLIRHPYAWNEKSTETYYLSSQAISLGCEIVVAIFLIRKAGWLATIVFPVEQELALSISASDLRDVLFAVVGLYFLLDGARHALGSVFQLVTKPKGDSQSALAYLWRREPENLVTALGGIGAGAFVLLWRRKRFGLWASLRGTYRKLFDLRESPDE